MRSASSRLPVLTWTTTWAGGSAAGVDMRVHDTARGPATGAGSSSALGGLGSDRLSVVRREVIGHAHEPFVDAAEIGPHRASRRAGDHDERVGPTAFGRQRERAIERI